MAGLMYTAKTQEDKIPPTGENASAQEEIASMASMYKDLEKEAKSDNGFSSLTTSVGTLAPTRPKSAAPINADELVKNSEKALSGNKSLAKSKEEVSGASDGDLAKKATPDGLSAGSKAGIAGMAASGIAEIAGTVADDGDADVYSDSEKAAEIGGAALKGAAAGAAFGPIGMAAGAVIGGATGLIASNKKNKELNNRLYSEERTEAGRRSGEEINNIQSRSNNLSLSSSLLYGGDIGGANVSYARNGLKFSFSPVKLVSSEFEGKLKYMPMKKPEVKMFKKGGKIKSTENIIPNGVLHEEDNSMGDKGMPVVKCSKKESCEKMYEIEKDEMILTLEATQQAEALADGGKLEQLGNFMAYQIVDNTHSFTEKYKYLNGENETIFD